jgi:hypothetical protein
MARIRKYDQFPKNLKQRNQDGCIPTNIAAVLQSYRMRKEGITEQEVTRACLSVAPDKKDWSFGTLSRLKVLSKLKPEGEEQSLDDFFVLRTRGFDNFDDWWKKVAYWINPPNGWPVLISYTREDGSIHTCTAIAIDEDKLEIYDPSPAASDIPTVRSDLEKVWSSTRPRLNHDVMAIEVKVEPSHHVEALHNYNTAAQFNATGLIVVVFGQFGILTLLESRATELSTCPVRSLILAYSLIMGLGCYFILNYLMFAQFIEKLRGYQGVQPLEQLEEELAEKVGKGLLKKIRAWFLKLPCLGIGACLLYLFISVLVLCAALNLPRLS